MASMIRRRLGSERGAELIELLLVTPILLLVFAGIFDFGMLFRAWEVVTNAAREGARVGSLPAYAANENVRQRVEQYMQASGLANACTIQTAAAGVCPATACSVCVSSQTLCTGAGVITARSVTVASNRDLPSLAAFAPFFGGSFAQVPVASTSVMRTEAAGGGACP